MFIVSLHWANAQEQALTFKIYPWHTEINVTSVAEQSFERTFEGVGPTIALSLPEGHYIYRAHAEGYRDVAGKLSVPVTNTLPFISIPHF